MTARLRIALYIVLMFGLAAASLTLDARFKAESSNSRVDIAVDLDAVRSLAASQGSSWVEVLKKLRQSGVTTLAVTQVTMGDLLDTGLASVGTRESGGGQSYIVTSKADDIQRDVERALVAQGYGAPTGRRRSTVLLVPPSQLAQIPIGYDLRATPIAQARKAAGLRVIGRVANFPLANSAALKYQIAQAKKYSLPVIIFAGEEVFGWRGSVDQTAESLNTAHIAFGAIEFGKQKGSEKLEGELEGQFIRVHSISSAELARYSPAEAVERFVRAARERTNRLLFVNLPFTSGEKALEQNVDMVKDIAAGLRRSGLEPGAAGLLSDPKPAAWQLALMALGIAAGAALLTLEVLKLRAAKLLTAAAVLALVLIVLALSGTTGRKACALAAALVFPTLAAAQTARLSGLRASIYVQPESPPDRTRASGIAGIASRYLSAIAVAVFGGLFVAALLSGRVFMSGADQFAGVKLAHLLPVLAVALLAAGGTLGAPLQPARLMLVMRRRAAEIMSAPLYLGAAVAGAAGLLALLIVVARSGNDAGVGVSGIELRLRALLDTVLYVRPRTKEILVGYPALVAALWLVRQKRHQAALVCFVVSVVGLVSAVNTFCHIHTPLWVSLFRVINGAWVGAIGGVVLVWFLGRALGREPAA